MSRQNEGKRIILDIESSNHLQKDCDGDYTKLKMGLAGIKILGKEEYSFFNPNNIAELKEMLTNAEAIIGFNLVSNNGLDYHMLENHGIDTVRLREKTFDIMTLLIRSFGSYENLNLSNIAKNTLNKEKKKNKESNYKLINNGRLEEVKENLKLELDIIEQIFHIIAIGGTIRFETPGGIIDEHVVPFYYGFEPEIKEETITPYDFFGMKMQIKDKTDDVHECHTCHKKWRVQSVCYYGDTISEEVFCPNCPGKILCSVRSSLCGPEVSIFIE